MTFSLRLLHNKQTNQTTALVFVWRVAKEEETKTMDSTVLFDFACVDHGPVQFKEIRPYARANPHKLSQGRFRWWRLSKLQLSASTDSTSTTNIFYSGDVPHNSLEQHQLLERRKIALIGQQLYVAPFVNPGFTFCCPLCHALSRHTQYHWSSLFPP